MRRCGLDEQAEKLYLFEAFGEHLVVDPLRRCETHTVRNHEKANSKRACWQDGGTPTASSSAKSHEATFRNGQAKVLATAGRGKPAKQEQERATDR